MTGKLMLCLGVFSWASCLGSTAWDYRSDQEEAIGEGLIDSRIQTEEA